MEIENKVPKLPQGPTSNRGIKKKYAYNSRTTEVKLYVGTVGSRFSVAEEGEFQVLCNEQVNIFRCT